MPITWLTFSATRVCALSRFIPANDLPHGHRDDVGVVGGADPVVGVGHEQVLQRHRERGRRALRVHLGADVTAGLEWLTALVEAAAS